MMTAQVIWHGTSAEGGALVEALSHNCDCKFGAMGVRLSTCVAHEAFAHDQRFLDHLLDGLHRRADLLREEFLLERERE